MNTLFIILIVSVIAIILLATFLVLWLKKTLFNDLIPRWVNGESIYNSEYQYDIGFIYSGEKRSTEGNVIAIVKGQLVDLNEELDRAIIKDSKSQHHAVSLSSLKEVKTIKN